MHSPITSLRRASRFEPDIDGVDMHPVDILEPIEETSTRDICVSLMDCFDLSLQSMIFPPRHSAESIGSMWRLAAYQDHKAARIDLPLDFDDLREPQLFPLFLAIQAKVSEAIGFIRPSKNPILAAWEVAAQLSRPFVQGRSFSEIGREDSVGSVGRAAVSAGVRSFQRVGMNEISGEYQKPEHARETFRTARKRHLPDS